MTFDYDPRQSLSEQFIGPGNADGGGDGSLERALRHLGTAPVAAHQYGSGNVEVAMGMGVGGSGSGPSSAGAGAAAQYAGGASASGAALPSRTPRVKMETQEYPIRTTSQARKRHSGDLSTPSSEDQIDDGTLAQSFHHGHGGNGSHHHYESGQQVFKRRRGNDDDGDVERPTSSSRFEPLVQSNNNNSTTSAQSSHQHQQATHRFASADSQATTGPAAGASSSRADGNSNNSYGVARIPSWRVDASFANGNAPTGAAGAHQQPPTNSNNANTMATATATIDAGDVRVVVPRTLRDDGGGGGGRSDPQQQLQYSMHPAQAYAQHDELTLTCPVPICRQVFVGKAVMLKHMRTHNEEVSLLA